MNEVTASSSYCSWPEQLALCHFSREPLAFAYNNFSETLLFIKFLTKMASENKTALCNSRFFLLKNRS
jgi:hypothetical protein